MTQLTEIGPDIFKISTFIKEANLIFNQFLVRDEEPLLYHTGMRGLFQNVKDVIAKLIDPSTIRWIGFSHFEADECGALREWQKIAPDATAICSFVSKINVINLTDRLVLYKISSWFCFMISWIFSSRPNRFYGSLENILQIGNQASDPSDGIMKQQCHHPFAF